MSRYSPPTSTPTAARESVLPEPPTLSRRGLPKAETMPETPVSRLQSSPPPVNMRE